MSSFTLNLQNLSLTYQNTLLFDDMNLTLHEGKWTCLLGPSGVGKSSLLRMIAHLHTVETRIKGKIFCSNEMPVEQQIAYMGQSDLLMPWLNVLDNVLISTRLCNKPHKNLKEKAIELLSQLGLKDFLYHYPETLSGGMRQRAALARTLLQDKPIILMDEPFSALDTITRLRLQTLTATLLRHRTVLWVTHDPLEALRLADDIYILSGRPAVLSESISLNSPTPREADNPELLLREAKLFKALIKADETT